MKLIFLGTRGGIKAQSKEHYAHSSVLIEHKNTKIMIDCGQDWLGKLNEINPDAIFITHAHPDHVAGLANGAPCVVYLTQETHKKIKSYPLHKIIIKPQQKIILKDLTIEAFEVEHSIHAPAVGYRVEADGKALFYVPDVAGITQQKEALSKIAVYIGDGALINRTMLLRHKNGVLTGHAPITKQLQWCAQENISRVIIAHCGSEIVKGSKTVIEQKIQALADTFGIEIQIAYDGLTIFL